MELVKKFGQGNLKFGVNSGNVSGTGTESCIFSVIFNLTVFILMQNISHINVKKKCTKI